MAGEASHGGDRGRDAVRALVLLGADPLGDFPDRALAGEALSSGHFVVAVTGIPSPSVDACADVVLPCAVAHERAGTTTNIEGRVSRLGPKLIAPGIAWPDWMVAAELAAASAPTSASRSMPRPGDEIERIAPGLRRAHPAVLHSRRGPRRRRGAARPPTTTTAAVSPIDPIAPPGIESVEGQGAPPRVGTGGQPARARRVPRRLGEPAARCSRTVRGGAPSRSTSPRPTATRCGSWPGAASTTPGSSVTGSPSLAPLVPPLVARANPYDLDRLGAADGRPGAGCARPGRARPRGRADAGVPRGVVAIDFNVPGGESVPGNAVGHPDRRRQPVTDVRMETV